MPVIVHFLPDDITIEAQAGESLLKIAQKAGIFIPTGCLMGSCHICEVELENNISICACIFAIPKDISYLTIYLDSDPLW
ncbi:MAG TPA: 2Fe-2S iron-sulfur cluster-binding protein [Allocoleopsis sp.]